MKRTTVKSGYKETITYHFPILSSPTIQFLAPHLNFFRQEWSLPVWRPMKFRYSSQLARFRPGNSLHCVKDRKQRENSKRLAEETKENEVCRISSKRRTRNMWKPLQMKPTRINYNRRKWRKKTANTRLKRQKSTCNFSNLATALCLLANCSNSPFSWKLNIFFFLSAGRALILGSMNSRSSSSWS